MAVYKEMGYLVRNIEDQYRQLFTDACDLGAPVYSFNDPIMKQVKEVCMHLYGLEPKTERYASGFTQTFEFDGEWPAVIEAGFEKATIRFVSCKDRNSKMIGYLEVHTSTSPSAKMKALTYDL